ncbi:MAG: helix-turn-helix transcriptional regulator [Rhizobiaceae bacterium]|nr:helix-turn-helix transcriptional regulator [Rhizobiaceae bacterium]
MLPVQCRMARAALNLGIRELAEAAKVSTNTITRFERGEPLRERTVIDIQATLVGLGITFLSAGETADGGPGVRMR